MEIKGCNMKRLGWLPFCYEQLIGEMQHTLSRKFNGPFMPLNSYETMDTVHL